MSGIRMIVKDRDGNVVRHMDVTVANRFPYAWRVTANGRTRRGFGFTLKSAFNYVEYAGLTWDVPLRTRTWRQVVVWAGLLIDIPRVIHRANVAVYSLEDKK